MGKRRTKAVENDRHIVEKKLDKRSVKGYIQARVVGINVININGFD